MALGCHMYVIVGALYIALCAVGEQRIVKGNNIGKISCEPLDGLCEMLVSDQHLIQVKGIQGVPANLDRLLEIGFGLCLGLVDGGLNSTNLASVGSGEIDGNDAD